MKGFKMKTEKGFGIARAMRVLLVAGITIAFGSTVFAGQCDWDGTLSDCDIARATCDYEASVAQQNCLYWCDLSSGGFSSEGCVSSCVDQMGNDIRHCDEEYNACVRSHTSDCDNIPPTIVD